jgi:hypothetical protein
MADFLGLFLLLRGRPDARFSTMTPVSIDNASVTHGELLIDWRASTWETLANLGKKMMRRRRSTVAG